MPEKLRRFLIYTFQLLFLLVPLVWTSNTSELFEFPKMMIVYGLTIVIASLWFARMVILKRVIFTKTPLFLPLILFFASQIISTLFSIDIHTSIFGYYSRFNGGLLSITAYLLLYFAAVSNLKRGDAKILINTIIATAIICSLYSFPEHFGHSPSCQIISGEFHAKCWVQDVQTRVFGTFGQPNWLAAFLISVIFIPLAGFIQKKPSWKLKTVHLGLFALFFLVLLFTKSRSGLLGFGLGILAFFTLTLWSSRTKSRPFSAILYILITIVSAFLIFGRGISATTDKLIPTPTAKVVTQSPDTTPANSLELNITPSSKIRQIVWQGAWVLAKKYPFFGTGVETFGYSYYNVRPIEHNLVSEWDFLYNKAHNEFLNYAATTGFIGLGAYLYFLLAYLLWTKKIITSSDNPNPSLKLHLSALLSGFLALCVSNFFGFSTVPVQLFLYLFPALSFLLTLSETNSPKLTKTVPIPPLTTNSQVALGLIVLGGCLLLYRLYVGYSADLQYTLGKAAQQSKSYQVAITKLQQAVKSVPNEPLYTDELSLTASEVAANLAISGKIPEASEAAAIAVELANRTLNLNKVHLNFYKSRAKIFINLSQVNPTYALEAASSLDAAIRLAPTDAKLWFNRGLMTEQLGFPKEALKIYEHAITLKPNYDLAKNYFNNLTAKLATQSATTP